MKKQPLTAGRLLERMRDTLELTAVPGTGSLDRAITSPNISSPGLVLSGYTERFPGHRMQVFGETEVAYLATREPGERTRVLRLFFSHAIPCVFLTKGQQPPDGLVDEACTAGVPVFISGLKTNEFFTRIKPWIEDEFSPTTTIHGSLADVFGVGLLFMGRSGIGKSECVLDLVERGHRLVADDLVFAKRRGNDVLIGSGHEMQRHCMEVRGIGVVDVPAIFGVRAVRRQKRIEVVVQLEEWHENRTVDRTGLDGETTTILEVDLPTTTVLLNPGKNITVVAEVIAMNHLLKYSGFDPAEQFNQRLIGRMRAAADVNRYLEQDDE